METYWLTLLVSVEQEMAIKSLFNSNGWQYKKKGDVDGEHDYSLADSTEKSGGTSSSKATGDMIIQDPHSFDATEDDIDNSKDILSLDIDKAKSIKEEVDDSKKKLLSVKLPNPKPRPTIAPGMSRETRKGGYMIVTRMPFASAVSLGSGNQEKDKSISKASNVTCGKPDKHVSDKTKKSLTRKRKFPNELTSTDHITGSPAVITEQVVKQELVSLEALKHDTDDENDNSVSDRETSDKDAASDKKSRIGSGSTEPGTVESPGAVTKRRFLVVRKLPLAKTASSTAGYSVNDDGNVVLKMKKEFPAVQTKRTVKVIKTPKLGFETVPGIEHVSELTEADRVKHFEQATEHPKKIDESGLVPSLSKYFCVDCKYLFSKQRLYNCHKRRGACVFACPECLESFTFRNYSAYEQHCQNHRIQKKKDVELKMTQKKTQEKPKSRSAGSLCQTCGQAFKSRSGYHDHVRRKHDGKAPPYSCCSLSFFSKTHFLRHRGRKHNDPLPYLCELCGEGFAIPGDLERHVHLRKNPKFTCKKCGAHLNVKGAFIDHMAMHNKEKNHHCKCGKKFTHRTSLSKHRRYCTS